MLYEVITAQPEGAPARGGERPDPAGGRRRDQGPVDRVPARGGLPGHLARADADEGAGAVPAWDDVVITSYSIHYTKLYELL